MVRGFAYFRRATELLGRAVDINMNKVQLAGKVVVAATVGKLCGSGWLVLCCCNSYLPNQEWLLQDERCAGSQG
jgi:hypothetical protein